MMTMAGRYWLGIENRLHRGQRLCGAGVDIGAAFGVQLQRPPRRSAWALSFAARRFRPEHASLNGSTMIWSDCDHCTSTSRVRSGVNRNCIASSNCSSPCPFHAAGQIEAQEPSATAAAGLPVEVERLVDHRRLRQADNRQRAARVEIGGRVGLDRGGPAKLDAPPGRGDPRLGFALEQKSLQVGEKSFDLLAAPVIDKAERRIADGYAVLGIDRVERLLPVGFSLSLVSLSTAS